MGWVQPLDLPGGTRTQTFGSPLRMNGAGPEIGRSPPALGEHTAEIATRYAQGAAGG